MIADSAIPRAADPLLQHMLDTYASETNKTAHVFRQFDETDFPYRPHARSGTTLEICLHQLLSERRFFAEFLDLPEPDALAIVPAGLSPYTLAERLEELALVRLAFLASQTRAWWVTPHRFFDVERQRIWIFWRRVLHSAHHRTQLTVYLRLLNKPVVSVYGPTADITWKGADPTLA